MEKVNSMLPSREYTTKQGSAAETQSIDTRCREIPDEIGSEPELEGPRPRPRLDAGAGLDLLDNSELMDWD